MCQNHGEPRPAPDYNPFRYGGQFGYYTLPTLGVINCGFRWYDPQQGRWFSRDPIGYEGGENLYEYCGSNPVGYGDPDGTSLISFLLKNGTKRLSRGFIHNFVATQIRGKIKKIGVRRLATRFADEADKIESILNDNWFEIVIGFIPIAGDGYDLVATPMKIRNALKKLDQLHDKIQGLWKVQGCRAGEFIRGGLARQKSIDPDYLERPVAWILEHSGRDKQAHLIQKLLLEQPRLKEFH
jgi:RHS repeat-associated protein